MIVCHTAAQAPTGITEDMEVAGIRALSIARNLLGDELSDETLVNTVFSAMLAASPASNIKAMLLQRPFPNLREKSCNPTNR